MPNSNTRASRLARQTTAARANQATVAGGGRRLGVLLPPDTAAKLRRIEDETGQSARQVIIGLIDRATESAPSSSAPSRCAARAGTR